MKKLNICFVTTSFVERGKAAGGLPHYLYRASQYLLSQGHHVTVIALSKRARKELLDGIRVIYCADSAFCSEKPCLSYIVRSLERSVALNREAAKLEQREQIDILQYTSLNGTALFRCGKTPAVVRLSSYARLNYQYDEKFPRTLSETMAFVERLASRRAVGIFAPSLRTAKSFGKDIGRRVEVIETPYEAENIPEDDCALLSLGGRKYVLFYGRLDRGKGLESIRDMIGAFLSDYPEYVYVLVGEQGAKNAAVSIEEVRRGAGKNRERVIHLNGLDHERLYPLIRRAEAVTLPSLMENLSNACIESMALNGIVIGTAGASFEQLIEDGKSGYLAKIGDADSLYGKLREALSQSAEERERMKEAAGKRVESLRPEITMERLLRYYRYIIRKSEQHTKACLNIQSRHLHAPLRSILSIADGKQFSDIPWEKE